MKITRCILSFLIIAFTITSANAAKFMPIATNYTSKNYHGGLQNWRCAQGANGEMYFANNNGILRFDGYLWELYKIPNRELVRSLFYDNGRLYVGTFKDFGYVTFDEYGEFQYTSLGDDVRDKFHDEEIWSIFRQGEKIYFQSFTGYYTYDGKHTRAYYNGGTRPLYLHKVDDRIYAQLVEGDFCEFINGRYVTRVTRKALHDDYVVEAIKTAGRDIILCTEDNGLFHFNGTTITPFHTEIDNALKISRLNRAAMIEGDSIIVLGTIANGAYAIDMQGHIVWHFNMENGLNNNSVLHAFVDRDKNTWLALDNGISVIHTNSQCTKLSPTPRFQNSLGMVYDVEWQNNNMYIASNIGAFIFNPQQQTISQIPGTSGQNWHITKLSTAQMILGNNDGPLEIDFDRGNATPTPIFNTTESSTGMKVCNINGQTVLLESTYSGFKVYHLKAGKWRYSNNINNFGAPVRQFEVDANGMLWVSHMSQGLYSIELSHDITRATNVRQITLDKSLQRNFVMKIHGQVVLSAGKKLYIYDSIRNAFVEYKLINDIINDNIIAASQVNDNTFWLASALNYYLVGINDGKAEIINTVSVGFFNSETNDTDNQIYTYNGKSYFPLNDGVGCYDLNWHSNADSLRSHLRILRVITTDGGNTKTYLPTSSATARPDSHREISFLMSFPQYDSNSLMFAFNIEGAGIHYTKYSDTPEITFSSLSYGSYVMTATVQTRNGRVIDTLTYEFTVTPPFYLSIWACIVYLALLVGAIYIYSKWRQRVALRKRNAEFESEKIKQDMKMMEQQALIDKQQKQLLENELQMKGKEIASLALNVYAKNRAIEGLRTIAADKHHQGNMSQKEAEAILKQLSANEIGDTEFWTIYQNNFDLIHDKFFRTLRDRFPDLTSNDIKLCAFLRLNMTTKDIAKIANLTVRGVESARYRLRKRLNLPEDVSLVDFLIELK